MGLRLAARDLHVRFHVGPSRQPHLQTLFHIDALNLAAADSLALYGPSGSGKTTLLHLLAGLQRTPDAQVSWHTDCAETPPVDLMQLDDAARDAWRLQNVGIVFQQFQLLGSMTALENVLTPLRLDHWRCPKSARSSAMDLLSQFGIQADIRCGLLSRGEQQRVAIARALVRQPQLVLADEPSASLDPVTSARVMNVLIDQCRQRQITLIVATHDPSLANRFDRAVQLRDQRLSAWVSP